MREFPKGQEGSPRDRVPLIYERNPPPSINKSRVLLGIRRLLIVINYRSERGGRVIENVMVRTC